MNEEEQVRRIAEAMERRLQQERLRQRMSWLPLIVFGLLLIVVGFFVLTNWQTFLAIWNRLTQPGMDIPE